MQNIPSLGSWLQQSVRLWFWLPVSPNFTVGLLRLRKAEVRQQLLRFGIAREQMDLSATSRAWYWRIIPWQPSFGHNGATKSCWEEMIHGHQGLHGVLWESLAVFHRRYRKGIKPPGNSQHLQSFSNSCVFAVTKGVIFSSIITIIPSSTHCAKGYLVSNNSFSFVFGSLFILNVRSLRK